MEFKQEDVDNLLTIMKNRRDVRGNRFLNKAIEKEKIDLILEAALTAPSVGYSQPWEFVLIDDAEKKDEIFNIYEVENEKAKSIFEHRPMYERLRLEGIKEAPLNIAVLYKDTKEDVLGKTSMSKMGEYSVVCAVQNMWLMARALNIGMGWVSILDEKKVIKTIGATSEHKLVAYICLGYVNYFLVEPELKILGWEKPKEVKSFISYNIYNK